jgi:hypothetical protein
MVEKINYWEYKEGGEDLQVPYRASAAVVYNSNLPYVMANRLIIKVIYFI